jgi:hypothetical protein
MSKLQKLLISTLTLSLLNSGYSQAAQAFNIGFQTEIKLNNNESNNDNFSIFNTSDSGSSISITQIVFTLGENAELDTSQAFPTINSSIANSHWGGSITSNGNQGLTTSLSSFSDRATQLTFNFTQGQFNPGEGFALNIDFEKRSANNSNTSDPVGGDWSNAQLDVTFSDGAGTDTLTYKYNSATINSGNKKSFPTDSLNGDTIAPGQFCSPSNPDTCAYDTLGFSSPYAQFDATPVPLEFSPTLGLLMVGGIWGFSYLLKRRKGLADYNKSFYSE